MDVTIYHNPRCGKSRDTLALLRDRGLEPTVVEHLATPPDARRLGHILKLLGISARALIRDKEVAFREQGLEKPGLDENALIVAMVASPILIERPIVVVRDGKGERAAIGRPPEEVLKIL